MQTRNTGNGTHSIQQRTVEKFKLAVTNILFILDIKKCIIGFALVIWSKNEIFFLNSKLHKVIVRQKLTNFCQMEKLSRVKI